MTAQRIGWLAPIIICIMIIYALWNIAAVRRDLMRAEEYRLELIQQTQAVAAETERLEREIARSADSAVMERIARTRLGLVYPGELIFCGGE
ncbi:MAG: septum formation initiator family protein [Oscillospiraceae bacterium]|nr:septum formation initiator family protein [Oscillospiraceae bacterium]